MCKDILTVCVINLHVLAVLNWYRHLFILKLLCLFLVQTMNMVKVIKHA